MEYYLKNFHFFLNLQKHLPDCASSFLQTYPLPLVAQLQSQSQFFYGNIPVLCGNLYVSYMLVNIKPPQHLVA